MVYHIIISHGKQKNFCIYRYQLAPKVTHIFIVHPASDISLQFSLQEDFGDKTKYIICV
jgi:hypothetical protein